MADLNVPRRSAIGSGVLWTIGALAGVIILWMLFAWGTPAPS
jgi:hypothetical protein